MKRDFNLWLATRGDAAPVTTLGGLREWNQDPRLVGIAYAFEQATRRRVPPPSMP